MIGQTCARVPVGVKKELYHQSLIGDKEMQLRMKSQLLLIASETISLPIDLIRRSLLANFPTEC